MHFPIEDVVKNVTLFVTNVKRATGNLKDGESNADGKVEKGKKKSKSIKPGKNLPIRPSRIPAQLPSVHSLPVSYI